MDIHSSLQHLFLEKRLYNYLSQLEQLEKLEQLRAIEAGKRIVVARVDSATPGIDTLDDFQKFERKFLK